ALRRQDVPASGKLDFAFRGGDARHQPGTGTATSRGVQPDGRDDPVGGHGCEDRRQGPARRERRAPPLTAALARRSKGSRVKSAAAPPVKGKRKAKVRGCSSPFDSLQLAQRATFSLLLAANAVGESAEGATKAGVPCQRCPPVRRRPSLATASARRRPAQA